MTTEQSVAAIVIAFVAWLRYITYWFDRIQDDEWDGRR